MHQQKLPQYQNFWTLSENPRISEENVLRQTFLGFK